MTSPQNPSGAFQGSLTRNNSEIRDDRAASLHETTQITYRRRVEDLKLALTKLRREQDALLDLSPTHADSLVLAADFNAAEYTERDLELAVAIRNTEIKYQLAKKRYEHLFGTQEGN